MAAFFPLDTWASGITQPDVPVNNNVLKMEVLARQVISKTTDAQPGSPSEGDSYIMTSGRSGAAWTTFAQYDVAIYWDGAWYNFAPYDGMLLVVAGEINVYDTTNKWVAAAGSSQGRHMIPVMAGAIQPSVSGGCSAVTSTASAANQPDIVTLDFDTTTQEYAQFSIPMPESWNEGTVTFQPIWSHAATTTNFGVVWSLQGYACSNDDAIATAFGTAQTSTDTGGTTNDLYVGPESSAITIAGTPAAGDTVFFRISRETGNGSDTMAIDARLHGIRLYITTNADTDA